MTDPIPVVICDDSSMARKQMARALKNWNVDITFAEHGLMALEAISNGKGDVMFLDLNMPIMDGYQVLERIRRDDLPTLVIVVSGDIQPEAHTRVLDMGALDFIQKPFTEETVTDVLHRFGLLSEVAGGAHTLNSGGNVELADYYQEVANVAMGRAGDGLARVLNAFIHLPVPHVKNISRTELTTRLKRAHDAESRVISQGFVASEITGEAMLIVPGDCFEPLAGLLDIEYKPTEAVEIELLMDVANPLIGAFLKSFFRQLDVEFSCSAPVMVPMLNAIPEGSARWDDTLSITIEYGLFEHGISCELVLIFSQDSLPALRKLSSYF